jgi:hypothetical protein
VVARLFRRQRALDPQEVFRAVGRVASELATLRATGRPLRRRETFSTGTTIHTSRQSCSKAGKREYSR